MEQARNCEQLKPEERVAITSLRLQGAGVRAMARKIGRGDAAGDAASNDNGGAALTDYDSVNGSRPRQPSPRAWPPSPCCVQAPCHGGLPQHVRPWTPPVAKQTGLRAKERRCPERMRTTRPQRELREVQGISSNVSRQYGAGTDKSLLAA
jgi:hypothetical protein